MQTKNHFVVLFVFRIGGKPGVAHRRGMITPSRIHTIHKNFPLRRRNTRGYTSERDNIMTISEKVAYLKGLAEGLDLDTQKSKEGKLISVMIGILEEVALSIEDLEENALALGEEIDALSDDLSDVESVVFDEDEDDMEDDEEEEDFFEVECPTCEEPLVIDEEALAEGIIVCPNCDSKFSLDLTEDDEAEDDEK